MEESQNKIFKIEGPTIDCILSTIEVVKEDLINLSDKDKEFIVCRLVDADILLKQLDPNKNILNYSAKDLDDLIEFWMKRRSNFQLIEEEDFVNAISAAFGNCINNTFNFIWTVVNDEYGTAYACIPRDTSSLIKTFPFDSVWKSIEQNRERSLEPIIDIVKSRINKNN